MRRFVLAAVAAAALAAPLVAQGPASAATAAPGPNTWIVDSAHSQAGFSVKHMMVSTVRGTLGKVSGTIEYDGTSAASIKADITIDVTGINTGVTDRDNDLKSPNFFNVAKFPTATFKSKRVNAVGAGTFKLVGDLTLHGVTKEVTLDVEGPSAPVKQQNGALRVGATATTTLNRRDFGLQYNALIEAGPVVGDTVHVTIDIEANKRG
ncbi:MAG TPA: YceI family protein [Vicinamibacterales bacterium]